MTHLIEQKNSEAATGKSGTTEILLPELAVPLGGISTTRIRELVAGFLDQAEAETDLDKNYRLAATIAIYDKMIRDDETFNTKLRAHHANLARQEKEAEETREQARIIAQAQASVTDETRAATIKKLAKFYSNISGNTHEVPGDDKGGA